MYRRCKPGPTRRLRAVGFTLIEVLTAILVSTILLYSLVLVFRSSARITSATESEFEILQKARSILSWLERDVTAAYDSWSQSGGGVSFRTIGPYCPWIDPPTVNGSYSNLQYVRYLLERDMADETRNRLVRSSYYAYSQLYGQALADGVSGNPAESAVASGVIDFEVTGSPGTAVNFKFTLCDSKDRIRMTFQQSFVVVSWTP